MAVFAASITVQAQTIFDHDAAGNRRAQETAGAPAAPFITTAPAHQTGRLAGTARFSAIAGGQGPFSYQWLKNGAPIDGAISDTLVLTSLVAGDFTPGPGLSPSYSVRVTNAHGSVISGTADLYQDSIGAGLPDWWRTAYFSTSGSVNPYADADGDGVTNGQEYADGTRPNNGASRLSRVTLLGPQALMSRFPEQDTYAGGAVVSATGSHSGELQFGGFTGSFRNQGSLGVVVPGSNGTPGDVVLKGLFGSMPVQKAGTAPTFTYDSNSQATVTGFATSPGGTWIAYGLFNRVNGLPRTGVAQFLPDGTLNTNFAPNPNGLVHGAAMLADGSTVLAGYFSEASGQQRSGVARFTPYGLLDTTFAPTFQGTGSAYIACMEVQGDGRILLGGDIGDGPTIRYIVRLNADGTTDASFTTTTDSRPTALRQQPDGKILMGGDFTQVNGTATPKLVRLNLDGTLDGSFNLNAATGAITSLPARVVVQPDGKILVAGSVQVRLSGGTVTLPLVRLHADGTVDSVFTQKILAQTPAITFADLALQTDGRIVGVGTFTLTSPSVVNAVRFKADGSVDPDCFVISRPDAPVRAVAAQMDGSLLLGGTFSDVAVATAMVNNHRYYITPTRMTWSDAEAHAMKLGGHLVSIGSAKENSFIPDSLLPGAGLALYPVWHGFHDRGTEGFFSWSSGDPVSFTNWNPGEPSNFAGENNAIMNWRKAFNGGSSYVWDETLDGGTGGFGGNTDGPYHGVIEVDPGSTPVTTENWVAGRDLMANEKAGAVQELTNPNAAVPQWSYGTRATQTSASNELNLYTSGEHLNSGGDWEGWRRAPYATVGAVTRPEGLSGGLRMSEIIMHPPASGHTVVRWTAPMAALYRVSALWQDSDWSAGDGAQASIVKNGTTVVYNYNFDNRSGAFATETLALAAGDVIDFLLGPRGTDGADTTRFNASITRITNPAYVWVGGRDLSANEKPDGPNELLNPNPAMPQWSYGSRTTIRTTGVNLYGGAGSHVAGGGVHGPMEGWGNGGAGLLVNTNTSPDTPPHYFNFGFGNLLPFYSQEMLVSPAGSGGPHPVVRWTAPEAGRYDVLAYWQDADPYGGNGVDAFILVNGSQVYGQNMDNGSGCSTVQSLDLKAGDLVDFVLGDRGEWSFDTTKFNVVIARPADSIPRNVGTGTVTQATTRAEIGETGKINWANAAANTADVNGNPFVIESSSGHRYIVRKSTVGNFRRLTQGSGLGWSGNFAPGDAVLNHGNSDGPVIIEHASLTGACSAIGMQIEANQPGPFIATLRAYDANGVLLGTFTANGTSAFTGDNTAVFLGVKSTAENIHSISIDTNTTDWGGDFAINQVSIQSSPQGSLSNPRANFARLVTTNSVRPTDFYSGGWESIFAANAPATLYLTSSVSGTPVNFAVLESSANGSTFQPFSYGATTDGSEWTFPVAILPPGYNYFRAMLRNDQREEARSHAVVLVTPPVVTSPAAATGEVGMPFTYTGTATGKLTGFTTMALPAWATAAFDANSSRLTITGTPTSGGAHHITLHPANEAGSSATTLTLTIISGFSNWQSLHFTAGELANPAISGPLGDATGAGIPNLLKYALGIPPKRPGNAGMPTGSVAQDGGSKYLTLTYTRAMDAEATIEVQVGGNLAAWQSGSGHTTELSRVPNGDNTETVTVRDNIPLSSGGKRFMRLRVSE